MLRELRIENLLLIERAELRLGEGLNVITGETGAGKTILAHSLDLLMGGRARAQIVRPGAGEAYVEGVFDIPEGFLEDPDLAEIAARLPEGATEIMLARRVSAQGRTSAFVQGRMATAPELKELGGRLLAFYGQHEHRRLTLASAQLQTLDGFAGVEHLARRRSYRSAHAEVLALGREFAELREREGARERDLDLLRFELSEIEAANPDAAEEEDLAAERERLRHAEGLRGAATEAMNAASGADGDGSGAVGAIGVAEAALAAVDGVDPRLDALAERTRAAAVELTDLAAELRSYAESVDAEPGRLEQVEERLDAIDRLKRKHGGSVQSVLAHAEHCRTEIEKLEGADERSSELEAELAAATAKRAGLAAELTAARREAADELSGRVAAELEALAMSGAQLEVVLAPHPDGFSTAGAETVELRLATNPGMPVSPLRDAASGGELSRVMLALAGQAGRAEASFVFDEIDAGIGGKAARAVGERLRALGAEGQVLCITHLPQVASLASTHFRITKTVRKGESLASVDCVEGEEKVAEITRMLGADRSDDAATRHARDLLEAA
ncbi:MAG: repair protein RecN [Solirubrobacterales bacterium]|nr:repair protein RecN [Solirubrobacterales bacterium]